MELDSFLVSLYVLVDDWLRERHLSAQVRLGRPTLLSESEVLTLAILAQWPRSAVSGTSGGSPTPTCASTSLTC